MVRYNMILHTAEQWQMHDIDHTIYYQIDGLAQDCSNSIALAMELLQSCTKPLKQHSIPHPHRFVYSVFYEYTVAKWPYDKEVQLYCTSFWL